MTIYINNITIAPSTHVTEPLVFSSATQANTTEDTKVDRRTYTQIPGDAKNKKSTFTYSDMSQRMFVHPVTGNITKVYDVASIKQSIKNLVLESKYERVHQPRIGGSVRSSLFELGGDLLKKQLEERIKATLQSYEPRAIYNDIEVDITDNTANITIIFTPVNESRSETVNIFLEQIR